MHGEGSPAVCLLDLRLSLVLLLRLQLFVDILHIVIFVQPVLFLLCLSLLMGLFFSHLTIIPHLSGIWNTYIENPDLDPVIRTVLSGNIFF